MKRSQLESAANKTVKQRNLIVNLNKKEKETFLDSLSIENNSKPCSSKGIRNIILFDKEGFILKETEVVREFNIHFQSITSSLGLIKWLDSSESLNEPDLIKNIVNKYKNYPSIKTIKGKYITINPFSFDQLLPRMYLMLFPH